MIPEAILVAILVIVFIADFATAGRDRRSWLNPLVCVLMAALTVVCVLPHEPVTAFGEMYVTSQAVNVMKAILAGGSLVVCIMSRQWITGDRNCRQEAEFYMLVVSTLLGMFIMMSSGHFLMFYLGLEMASIPMACLVAFDRYRNNSAEGAAKYILTASFSSGVMLFGLSFLYANCGTLYFSDMPETLKATPLVVTGLAFFFSGLGFKISLVPFHFWTADTYEGAPTVVTGYLSVVSKGAAAFTLMTILFKVFPALSDQWHYLLYVVIVLSITVANLFAIRQKDLKRFMAFSSISQAGYIMLALVGEPVLGSAALSFYVLVYVAANLRCHQRGGAEQRRYHQYGCLQRLLYHQPQAFVPHDAGALLAGRHPALRRYVQQVLRFHGGCLGTYLRQYHGRACLHAARFPQRCQHAPGTGTLHSRHPRLRCGQLHLSVDLFGSTLSLLPLYKTRNRVPAKGTRFLRLYCSAPFFPNVMRG